MLRDALLPSQHHQGQVWAHSLTHGLSLALARVPQVGPILGQALQTADGASRFTLVVCTQGGSGRRTGSHCLSWVSAGVDFQARNECRGLFGWWSQKTLSGNREARQGRKSVTSIHSYLASPGLQLPLSKPLSVGLCDNRPLQDPGRCPSESAEGQAFMVPGG